MVLEVWFEAYTQLTPKIFRAIVPAEPSYGDVLSREPGQE